MFKKATLAAAVALSALTALPSAAAANHGYYDQGRYERTYRDGRAYRGDRYYRDYRSDRSYRGDRYVRGRYGNRYYNGRRCSGSTGTLVGGAAGALLGREVAGRGDRTVGTILGAAVGALTGRAIDKSDCR